MSGARDLPADLIERAARELALNYSDGSCDLDCGGTCDCFGMQKTYAERGARAVLTAVADHWPTPTAHRDNPDYDRACTIIYERTVEQWVKGSDIRDALEVNHDPRPILDALLAAGVLRDAAHVETEARRAALTEAADAWQHGQWADAPRCPDRVQERIANGQYVTDWLRARIARDTTAGTT